MCGFPFKDDAVACSDEEFISWAQGLLHQQPCTWPF